MRKYLLILSICFVCCRLAAQQYYNEWIDYSKTYYKFKLGSTGLYRINQPNLPAPLQSVPAEQFQLWRNGKEVPIYTSVSSGPLPSSGYIEFWGERNDGKPDKNLYKNPADQLSDKLSLETDTASYFLTVNAGVNLRLVDAPNNVNGNILPAEQSFTYHYRYDFQTMINRGRAVSWGTNVYSSTYDMGEWWSSRDISPDSSLSVDAGNLYASNSGSGQLNISVAGNSAVLGSRTVNVDINGANVINYSGLAGMSAAVLTTNVTSSQIGSADTKFTVSMINGNPEGENDRIVVGFIDLGYPRQFNFGGASQFAFSMPATGQGYFLKITNFNSGLATPVLYDLTNNKRYTANTNLPGVLQFVLPASASSMDLVLVSENSPSLITNFLQRTFQNFSVAANQGTYLIISNKVLIGNNGPVQAYAAYRNSGAGGSFTSRIYDIDELVDQFAYGIKMHPLSVKNFLKYARNNFPVAPKFAFLIGKAVTYDEARIHESSPYIDRLNLVPTFGWPASDNILASNDLGPVPATPIGRLAAVTPAEVDIYLKKITDYEKAQADSTHTIEAKAWMKNIVHVIGADDPGLNAVLTADMNSYRRIVTDTASFGANVTTFNKTTSGSGGTISDALMSQLFSDGISLINYFGHSSASVLDYNLNKPQNYNNPGKYPVFFVNGCDAGNIYSFDTTRFSVYNSLSEAWVFAQNRGSIAYIASTHFGVESYLDAYITGFYNSFDHQNYNKPVSYNIRDAASYLVTTAGDFTGILHAEENVLHGDPALKINAHPKPDFVVEEPGVIITPTFVSVADNSFKVKCYFYNIGKATGDSVSVLIQRKYPDNSTAVLFSARIPSVRFIDSVEVTVPIVATRDKGLNAIIVTIDNTGQYDELSELNNTVTKQFFIYEDELKPVYPYDFSIVNKSNIKVYASTANPVVAMRSYVMEMDTTELFNSAIKSTQTINSVGGVLEFNSTIPFTDSTVYYWRVAPVPTSGAYHWNTSSFVYLPNAGFGFNQSHLYQHLKSVGDRIYIDSFSRRWTYNDIVSILTMYNAVYGHSGQYDADFQVQINGKTITSSACLGHSIIFNLFDPVTLKPYYNQNAPSTNPNGPFGGFMQSFGGSCTEQGHEYNFEFHYWDTTSRRQMRDFMDWIPDGLLVTVRLIYDQPYDQTAALWKSDQTVYGVGNTFYDRLKQSGFAQLDSFSYPRTWVFDYEKNNSSFVPGWQFSQSLDDFLNYSRYITSADTLGFITSPAFGPAKAWKKVLWNGYSLDAKAGDRPTVDVIGVDSLKNETVLYTLNTSQQNFDISSVSVLSYPYLKLRMRNADSINLTPYQLRWWTILYEPVPEGALAPNLLYYFKDTVALGQTDTLEIAFKNVSEVPFADSILVNLTVFDANNVANNIAVGKLKALNAGDTGVIRASISTVNFPGVNNLYLDVNPNNAQPEQTHFNNFLYQGLVAASDVYKPTLDITFDGVHILNDDIVAAKPHVLIKMKDESGYLLLDDTSLITVQLRYPDGTLRQFYFNTDTLLFTPPTSGANNVATVDFTPFLTDDGTYQLIVHGKDKTGNTAGNVDYMVSFVVYNKPMISNLFNYPNPFTTSTAFVFTVTGSQVPQNIRIQILTITGKIVREITMQELGPLHIGRNITDYKWDGTDQYGQKLANGVYLYRVLTNLNGKSLDKFPTYGQDGFEVNTDKFFTKGYGKMYLMR